MSAGDAPLRRGAADQRRAFRAVVRGQVQGVGYRWFAQRIASRLELSGWVANRADSSVEVVAEGPESDLTALLEALRDGPPSAHVSEVEVTWLAPSDRLVGFSIRSGSHPGD
jgi:acylphosphatase